MDKVVADNQHSMITNDPAFPDWLTPNDLLQSDTLYKNLLNSDDDMQEGKHYESFIKNCCDLLRC